MVPISDEIKMKNCKWGGETTSAIDLFSLFGNVSVWVSKFLPFSDTPAVLDSHKLHLAHPQHTHSHTHTHTHTPTSPGKKTVFVSCIQNTGNVFLEPVYRMGHSRWLNGALSAEKMD